MPIILSSDGVNKQTKTVPLSVNGTNINAKSAWAGVGGVNQKVFSYLLPIRRDTKVNLNGLVGYTTCKFFDTPYLGIHFTQNRVTHGGEDDYGCIAYKFSSLPVGQTLSIKVACMSNCVVDGYGNTVQIGNEHPTFYYPSPLYTKAKLAAVINWESMWTHTIKSSGNANETTVDVLVGCFFDKTTGAYSEIDSTLYIKEMYLNDSPIYLPN